MNFLKREKTREPQGLRAFSFWMIVFSRGIGYNRGQLVCRKRKCAALGYFYAALWLIVGFVLIFTLSKENKIFYLAGGFFLLLGVWWLLDSLLPVSLFAGWWGVALRVVTLAALAVMVWGFLTERRRNIQKDLENREDSEKDADKGE